MSTHTSNYVCHVFIFNKFEMRPHPSPPHPLPASCFDRTYRATESEKTDLTLSGRARGLSARVPLPLSPYKSIQEQIHTLESYCEHTDFRSFPPYRAPKSELAARSRRRGNIHAPRSLKVRTLRIPPGGQHALCGLASWLLAQLIGIPPDHYGLVRRILCRTGGGLGMLDPSDTIMTKP